MTSRVLPRHAKTGALIVLGHGLAVWGLLQGLGQRSGELVVPVVALAQVLNSPAEQSPARALPPAPKVTAALRPSGQQLPQPVAAPAPALSAAPAAAPSQAAQSAGATASSSPASQASPSAAASGSAVAAAATAPARVEMPSSGADYLNNPKPVYPPASKRMGEQGLVIVGVLIGADGQALKAEIRQSSGFERLDQAALSTTLRWRYVPGKRAGQPESMWFNVPINFVLE